MIEIATLAACLLVFYRFGAVPALLPLFFLMSVCVSIVDIDLHYKIIPDKLNAAVGALAAAAVVFSAFLQPDPSFFLSGHAVGLFSGAAIYGVFSYALRAGAMKIAGREPLGLGDVKFFAAAGAWLGMDPEIMAWFLALSGAFGVILALLWRHVRKEAEFPFGPALVAAFLIILALSPPPWLPLVPIW